MTSATQIQVECRLCGSLTLRPSDLRCAVDQGRATGICEFSCPFCSQVVLVPTTASTAQGLVTEGAEKLSGPAPFEVLEPHSGPPISWDEYLDLRLFLAGTSTPQQELGE
ncbi:MAG: hypothetical protein ACRDKS_01515 [Actinomycetota bacterium]